MPISASLILIADDHVDNVALLEQRLEQAGYRTAAAYDGQEALLQVEALHPDLLLLDIAMPRLSGLEVLAALRSRPEYQDLPIAVLTVRTEVQDRVAGLEAGADEYLLKPIEEAELLARVRALLRLHEAIRVRQRLEEENARLRQEMARRDGFGDLVGRSAAMQEVYRLIQKVAGAPAAVLITGESGTGKELVARAIHQEGNRAKAPFVPVNCSALPETLLEAELFGHRRGSFTGAEADRAGLLETADKGTLFLDEVGDLSPHTQALLLRVLQEGEVRRLGENQPRLVDVRLISATNKDLKAQVQAGRLREDLYFRLDVIQIRLPPLRDRREDILSLAEHFLARHCQVLGRPVPLLSAAVKGLLLDYGWPGNVRELEHEMERVATLGDPGCPVTAESLSVEVRRTGVEGENAAGPQGGALKGQMDRVEQRLIQEALERNAWNQTRTAEQLGLTRQGLIKKMQRLGVVGGPHA